MNILMLTNVYTPLVGGVTRSIQAFTSEFRRRGNEVLIVAPDFGSEPEEEDGVIRIPSVPNVYRDCYAWPLPLPGYVSDAVRGFRPDVIHTHHPFLLGKTGQRESVLWDLPLVFTHHTWYREFAKSEPDESNVLSEFLWHLTLSYCQLCDALIAPSRSIAAILKEAGVEHEPVVIPTGVDVKRFAEGDGRSARRRFGVPEDAFLAGTVSRLEPEKNWQFLAPAVGRWLRGNDNAHYLLVGDGRSEAEIRNAFRDEGATDRLHMAGTLEGPGLVDAYHALDVFVFGARTETQGMVVTEAMAAGVPVVAVDGSGVQDVVVDGRNGRLLAEESEDAFVSALEWIAQMNSSDRRRMCDEACRTAREFSLESCATKAIDTYESAIESRRAREPSPGEAPPSLRFLRYQWQAWSALLDAAGNALFRPKAGSGENSD